MAKELFNQTLVTALDDNDRLALSQPSTGGAKNILYSVFKGLMAAIGWNFTNAITVLTPTADMNPTTKKYVDDGNALNVQKAGTQTITGDKTFSGYVRGATPTNAADLTRKDYVDTLDGANVKKDGSVAFTGKQTFNILGINIPDFTGTLPINSADSMGVVGDIIYFRKDIYRKTSSDGWIKNGSIF